MLSDLPSHRPGARIIAWIEDPEAIEKILANLDAKVAEPEANRWPPFRAPPKPGLFGKTG